MLASYILSRTLVPDAGDVSAESETFHRHDRAIRWSGFSAASSEGSNGCARAISGLLTALVCRRVQIFVPVFLLACAPRCSFWCRGWARISFPNTDSGQFILHVRAKTGTRIEETARLCDLVENSIRREIPAE